MTSCSRRLAYCVALVFAVAALSCVYILYTDSFMSPSSDSFRLLLVMSHKTVSAVLGGTDNDPTNSTAYVVNGTATLSMPGVVANTTTTTLPPPPDVDLLKQFASIMTDGDRVLMAETLRRLTDVLDAANLSYHMTGGTLIGSYRHHGMVPWDDDVDIYCRWSERHRIESEIRRRMSDDYVLAKATTRWKVYSRRKAAVIPGWRWKYPFIDVCFTVEDADSVRDYDVAYGDKFRYRRATVYPLRRRPFMNMSLWAPHDPETYLRATYAIDTCSTNVYIHKHERGAGAVHTVDCRRLWTVYPFVFRRAAVDSDGGDGDGRGGIVEELKVGDRIVGSVRIVDPV